MTGDFFLWVIVSHMVIVYTKNMKLKINRKAPKFKLLDQDGKEHARDDYVGNWLLIYFYPKDDTPGCTKEACTLRDAFSDFKKLKVAVIGVSPDKVAKHKKFAENHDLPFALLADEDKKMVVDYDVWGLKRFMGREYKGVHRTSFLINPEGKIVKIYENVKSDEHAQQVLSDLKELQK